MPAALTVVSNGRLVSDRRVAGGLAYHALVAGEARLHLPHLAGRGAVGADRSDRWRDVPLDYYVYPEDSALARPLFGVTPDMMETYTRLTGVPLSLEQVRPGHRRRLHRRHGERQRDHAGGLAARSRAPTATGPGIAQSLIPHELAHQWFGNLVTAENWANYWLNEGLAEFMPGQYWGAKQGRHAEEDYYLDGVPSSTWPRRPPPHAARRLQLQQRVSQGRAGARRC